MGDGGDRRLRGSLGGAMEEDGSVEDTGYEVFGYIPTSKG